MSTFFQCWVLNKGTTGIIVITSLVWHSPWLGIEPGTSHTWYQHSTTRLSRKVEKLKLKKKSCIYFYLCSTEMHTLQQTLSWSQQNISISLPSCLSHISNPLRTFGMHHLLRSVRSSTLWLRKILLCNMIQESQKSLAHWEQ